MDKKNTAPDSIQNGTNGKANHSDTSARAQRFRLLAALKQGSVTTFHARADLNILMPAARVKELRSLGYNIATERIQLFDQQGNRHSGVAKYVLMAGEAA